ncbi:MAG: selenium metabolism-associated LysR family transcriptional regulator [Planctomycetota bacterium]|nr:selenium metabolism-associated LysR family transcriptional regulator [Planctomycetota bacterium]
MMPYEKIGLRHIESFFYAAKCSSFTKAAAELGVSQPTISENIAHLERMLGVSLFERVGRKVSLTEVGRIYFTYCERIIQVRAEAHSAVEEFLRLVRGTLLLGASNIPAVYILPSLISRFVQEFPSVQVKMRVGDSVEIEKGVVENTFHIGFIGQTPHNPQLSAEPFSEDEVVLVASPDSPYAKTDTLPLDHLKKVPLILREEGSATLQTFYDALGKRKSAVKDFKVVAILGSTESVKQAARKGVGLGVVSLLSVTDELKLGVLRVIRIEGAQMLRKFYWIYRTSSVLPPAANRFIKLIRNFVSNKAQTAN